MIDKIYEIKDLSVNQNTISFELSGHKVMIPLSKSGSKVLPHAKLEHLQIFELDDDGIGIHWPVLDEDLSIAGLLRSAGREDFVVKEIPSLYLDETPEAKVSHTFSQKNLNSIGREVGVGNP